jgi:hypothetical protein
LNSAGRIGKSKEGSDAGRLAIKQGQSTCRPKVGRAPDIKWAGLYIGTALPGGAWKIDASGAKVFGLRCEPLAVDHAAYAS